MHYLSFFTRVSQWYNVFFLYVELPCAFWNEASSLLRDTTGNERASGAGISLCMD
jgi:hypothetical protein